MDLDPIEELTNDTPVAAKSDNTVLESGSAPEMGRNLDKSVTREDTEESLAPITLDHANKTSSQTIGVYAVPNGMGGHEADESAGNVTVLRSDNS